MKTHVLIESSRGVGTLYRRGVSLGAARVAHGYFVEHAAGYLPIERVAKITAVPGELAAATYRRVAYVLGPRPKRVRPLLRSVCSRVA